MAHVVNKSVVGLNLGARVPRMHALRIKCSTVLCVTRVPSCRSTLAMRGLLNVPELMLLFSCTQRPALR